MSSGGYQGDLLELQKVAFARWKVEYEELKNQNKLRPGEKIGQVPESEVGVDPLLYIRNVAKIKQLEKTTGFEAQPRSYNGQLLELQLQIFGRWKNSDEYRKLLARKRKEKQPPPGISRELEWWEWIPISTRYKEKERASKKKLIRAAVEEPEAVGFKSVEYKVESSKRKTQRWDTVTKEPYKSLEYNTALSDKAREASHIDWNSHPLQFP